jgi:hypothetical protein
MGGGQPPVCADSGDRFAQYEKRLKFCDKDTTERYGSKTREKNTGEEHGRRTRMKDRKKNGDEEGKRETRIG